jgi:hypothetical protein
LDILIVKHACLNELNIFGCPCIICFHTMPHSLVPSYDKNEDNTCWVSHHTNDRFCIHANLICFSECLSCSFVLKDPQGGTVMKHMGHAKTYMMRDTNFFENIVKVSSFPLSHPHMHISNGPYFHCCFILLVYMIHLLDGGTTLKLGFADLEVEERSDLADAPTLDAPADHHSCHDIDQRYDKKLLTYCANTSIFVDVHARWTHLFHNEFALYEWIDSHLNGLMHLVFPHIS